MSMTPVQIDPQLQINEVIRRFPATVSVFHRAGLDACCGGGLAVADVAARHKIDLEHLLDELARVAGSER